MSSINFLKNKTILVTGGTGSFGKHFIKFLLAKSKAKKIIIFSRDELKQSRIKDEIDDSRLRFFLGDIRDLPRLQRAFYGVDIVVHAAALKQVPVLEYNPFEAIKTNIIGSQNIIEASIDCGVEKVLLISTDKAVQPVNLYGSTKLCAEKLFANANVYSPGKTIFSCVRYGNVVGSRGSIIEILLRKNGSDKFYITDERMTRFWMTLEQSFDLVISVLKNMVGGEIFVPKIPSMKVLDIFKVIVPQAKLEIIGVRPGEKVHETLLTSEEAPRSLEFSDYFTVLPHYDDLSDKKSRFAKLIKQGKAVSPGFCFSSDDNKLWLSAKEFKDIICKLNIDQERV